MKQTIILGYEKVQNTKIPILKAEPRHEVYLKVWCHYCKKYHLHGHGEGHRTAHCPDPDSPFYRTGYILKLEGDLK